MAETGLPQGRLEGERGRTAGQLRLFASVLRSGHWQQIAIDSALPQRQPAPRPELRMLQMALGPVAVFGASNFPLAFSVAGGDTASALAAGCPVVVKAHPSHPGTCELVGRVVREAVLACGLPEGVFSLMGGEGHAVGTSLVEHPAIQAVGFTGSRTGGLALLRVCQARAQPIPVYAEMSSINPVFVLPCALAARTEVIAQGFVDSVVMGSGQFCTNPGLVIGVKGPDWDKFAQAISTALAAKAAGTMLNAGIHRAYIVSTERLASLDGVQCVARGQATVGDACAARAVVHQTTASNLLATPTLEDEVFGPSSVLVGCDDLAQMRAAAEHLSGQLTATLQIDDGDHVAARTLLPILERRAGRILANGFPTGVEVGYAMVHGGPYPATSDSRSTSVGATAMARFLRPICYQDLPEGLLPAALTRSGLSTQWRIVDGEMRPPQPGG
jgi:NADP-dependent aldehyde dehydrogenase